MERYIIEKYVYDPETGNVYNKAKLKSGNPCKPLGYAHKNTASGKSYLTAKVKGKLLRVHRMAWLLHYGVWPSGQIDHINGNGLDNRIENLRDVTHVDNGRNCRRKSSNKSGVNGVYWCSWSGKWRAEIMVDRKKHCLGRYNNMGDAINARRSAEIKFGFHKNHGEHRPLY